MAKIEPITAVIVVLLVILVLSYRQVIAAYPDGGGCYAVSKANLGRGASLLAAASLIVDYVLTVAVSIAAGVAALVSAFPDLGPHSLLTVRFHIGPTSGQTVLSQVTAASLGRGILYYVVDPSTTVILALAANTSFGGFPVLASLLARDNLLWPTSSGCGPTVRYTATAW